MPTVNEALGGLIQSAVKNPKSTLSSILTVGIGVIPILLVDGTIHGKAAIIATSILGPAKVILGMLQKDPKATPANS